jgi:hypothetical protein
VRTDPSADVIDRGRVGGVDGVSDMRLDDSLVPIATSDRRTIAP